MRPCSVLRLQSPKGETVLADKAVIARGIIQRALGLLTHRQFDLGQALVIPRCSAIHTFGMRFPIDLVFLQSEGVVLRVMPRVPPGRLVWTRGAKTVIELPAGTLERTPVQPGELIAMSAVTVVNSA